MKFQPGEFLDWVLAVEEIFEFNGVPDKRRVFLVVHTFRMVVASWWYYLKQKRKQQGKLKISSWEQLLKDMLVTFVPQKYTMERQPQNWRQRSTTVMKKIKKLYKKKGV
jgi:hypothetical protein